MNLSYYFLDTVVQDTVCHIWGPLLDFKPVDREEHLIGASPYCSGDPNKLNWALESRVLGMCYDKG